MISILKEGGIIHEKDSSFTVNHDDLLTWYLRITPRYNWTRNRYNFDIRTKLPNREPVMNTAEIHTIEHLGATFLRNHETAADQTNLFWTDGMSYRILFNFKRWI